MIGKNLRKIINALYAKNEKIDPVYVSKHNSNSEKQVILLIIPNRDGWHYIALKKLSTLLTGITPEHHVNVIV